MSAGDATPRFEGQRVGEAARLAAIALRDPRGAVRAIAHARRPGVHQTSHATEPDRHPEIFRGVAKLVPHARRVLSFGCSTGEEPASLTTHFPEATIVGVDVSPRVVEIANGRYGHLPNVEFVDSAHHDVATLGPFDAVFAMSVLCRHPATKSARDSSRLYPFERFEEGCRELAELLVPHGVLVLYNTNYRFTDTVTSHEFSLVDLPGVSESGFVVKFDVDGKRSADQSFPHCAFRRR